jgi:hypothetical protein
VNLLLLLVPVLAAAGWARLFGRFSPDRLVLWLLAILCTLMQLSSGLALLGFLGWLRPGVAVGLEAAVTGGVWVAGSRGGRAPAAAQSGPAGAAAERAGGPDLRRSRAKAYGALAVVALLCLPIVARLLLYASVLEPYTMDGLAYHLPPLVEALQRGRFVVSETLNVWANSYPKNVEMIALWLMLGRSGTLILFSQIAFLPLGILGTALLARRQGLSTPLSLAAGLSLLFLPIVVAQAATEYIDIAMGGTLLACAALALLYRDGALPRPWGPPVLLAALGFLAGMKFNAPLIAAVFGLVAFLPDVLGRRLGRDHLVGVCLALPGVIWYFANLVWFKNPLWPFAIPGAPWLAPHTARVADIMLPNTPPEFLRQGRWLSTWQVWLEQSPAPELYSIDSRYGGLGPLWAALWLPAIPFWLYREIRSGRWRRAAGFAVLFGALFALMEASWWTRYTWWFAALGAVAFAGLWQEMPAVLKAAAGAAVVAGALFVLRNTSVQSPWFWERTEAVLQGEHAFTLLYGRGPYAETRRRSSEVIALTNTAWPQYYLYGDDYANRLVQVKAGTAAEMEAQLRAAGATLYFAPEPNDPVLALLPQCFEEVTTREAGGPKLYTFLCR